MTSLPEKIVAIDRGLAGVPHAFGGALALSFPEFETRYGGFFLGVRYLPGIQKL